MYDNKAGDLSLGFVVFGIYCFWRRGAIKFVKNSYICIGLNKIRYEETDIDAHSVEFSRTYGNSRSASEEA